MVGGVELAYGQLSGGIIHAKYMVVDGKQAFIGSQNFDWRSLEHIHETGLRISDATVVSQVQAIFNQDWQAQAALADKQAVPLPAAGKEPARTGNYLVASPQRRRRSVAARSCLSHASSSRPPRMVLIPIVCSPS